MPLQVYLYCLILTLSAVYGIHILKAKPTYIFGAVVFLLFCWLISIDYYLSDTQIFQTKISLFIYFCCAITWQSIEFRQVKPYIQSQLNANADPDDPDANESIKHISPKFIAILGGIGFIFYLPILYMGLDIFLKLPLF